MYWSQNPWSLKKRTLEQSSKKATHVKAQDVLGANMQPNMFLKKSQKSLKYFFQTKICNLLVKA